jgi:hypothetical protein
MTEVKDTMRVVGLILLGLFVMVVGIPLVLAAAGITFAGITLHIFGFVFGLAVGLIKLAVIVAIGYLALVGIRALLR